MNAELIFFLSGFVLGTIYGLYASLLDRLHKRASDYEILEEMRKQGKPLGNYRLTSGFGNEEYKDRREEV